MVFGSPEMGCEYPKMGCQSILSFTTVWNAVAVVSGGYSFAMPSLNRSRKLPA